MARQENVALSCGSVQREEEHMECDHSNTQISCWSLFVHEEKCNNQQLFTTLPHAYKPLAKNLSLVGTANKNKKEEGKKTEEPQIMR